MNVHKESWTHEQSWASGVLKSTQKRRHARNRAERVAVSTNTDLCALFEDISMQGSVFPFPWLLPETTPPISSFTSIPVDSAHACRALSYATLWHRPTKAGQAHKPSSKLQGLDAAVLSRVGVSKLGAAVLSLLSFPSRIGQMSEEMILQEQRLPPARVHVCVSPTLSLYICMFIHTRTWMSRTFLNTQYVM